MAGVWWKEAIKMSVGSQTCRHAGNMGLCQRVSLTSEVTCGSTSGIGRRLSMVWPPSRLIQHVRLPLVYGEVKNQLVCVEVPGFRVLPRGLDL